MNYDKHYREAQVDQGWVPIVDEMLESLKDLPVEIIQIKEKFGQLRVYYNINPVRTVYDVNAVAKAVEIAQYRAAHTCELCGKPGKLTNTNYMRVDCGNHRDD